jgi:sensor histidine kinase YesM
MFDQTWQMKFIKSIFMFFDAETYSSVLRDSYYQNAIERNKQIYLKYGDSIQSSALIKPENSPYAYYISTMSNIYFYRPLGKLVIELDFSPLLSSGGLTSLYKDTVIAIYDSKRNLFFTNRDNAAGGGNLLKDIDCAKDYRFEPLRTGDGEYFALSKKLDFEDLTCLILIRPENVYGETNRILLFFYVMVGLAVLLLTLLSIRILGRFFNPLDSLVARMSDFTSRTSSPSEQRPDDSHFEEIAALNKAYGNMSSEISRLLYEVYELKLLNQEAELDLHGRTTLLSDGYEL